MKNRKNNQSNLSPTYRPKTSSSRDVSPSRQGNSKINSRSTSPISQKDQSFKNDFNVDVKEFIFNVNDDHKTLINKNRKLGNLLIQASSKISDLVTTNKIRMRN